jgi:predicted 3-demethylubiquinone-9 3-methyltransferase (glyoxalase superfamily)
MSNSIYPCLWFDTQAHEAADFYLGIFPNAKLLNRTPFVSVYSLNGQQFMNMNGAEGPGFSTSLSLVVRCKDQAEIDQYWTALSQEGEEGKCGWLKDKYGVSWQIVPDILGSLMSHPHKAPKAMYAFMQMKKLIIADLIKAAEGE